MICSLHIKECILQEPYTELKKTTSMVLNTTLQRQVSHLRVKSSASAADVTLPSFLSCFTVCDGAKTVTVTQLNKYPQLGNSMVALSFSFFQYL